MDVYYARAREWSRSARIFAAFVERKIELETEAAKANTRAVRQALDALEEQKLESGGTLATSFAAILREQDASVTRMVDRAGRLRTEVLLPITYVASVCTRSLGCRRAGPGARRGCTYNLRSINVCVCVCACVCGGGFYSNQRDEHDRARKRMLAEYEKEKRKLADNEGLLSRAKARFHALSQVRPIGAVLLSSSGQLWCGSLVTRFVCASNISTHALSRVRIRPCQTWEKTIHEKAKELASSYKLKLDKRAKEEEEAHARVKAAEEAYLVQLSATNTCLQVGLASCQTPRGGPGGVGPSATQCWAECQATLRVNGGPRALQDLKRFTLLTQRALIRLVHDSDAKYKVGNCDPQRPAPVERGGGACERRSAARARNA